MGANGYIVRRRALRRRPGRRLLLRHRLRLRPRAARRADRRARRRRRSGTTSATPSRRFYLQDPPAHRRLLLLLARRAGAATRGRSGSAPGSSASSSRRCSSSRCSSRSSAGWRRKPDPAWLFHVPACWITLGVYAAGYAARALRAEDARPRRLEPVTGVSLTRARARRTSSSVPVRVPPCTEDRRDSRERVHVARQHGHPARIAAARESVVQAARPHLRGEVPVLALDREARPPEQRAHPFCGEREEVPRRVVAVPVPAEDARRERARVGRSQVEHTVGREQRAQVLERLERLGDVLDHMPQDDRRARRLLGSDSTPPTRTGTPRSSLARSAAPASGSSPRIGPVQPVARSRDMNFPVPQPTSSSSPPGGTASPPGGPHAGRGARGHARAGSAGPTVVQVRSTHAPGSPASEPGRAMTVPHAVQRT